MRTYEYITPSLRAQCTRVVDGDTCDLFVDDGRRHYAKIRVRLYGIDAPELNSSDPETKLRAQAAREELIALLKPAMPDAVLLKTWPIRVVTTKEDPDSFGRWLVDLWVWDEAGASEVHVNAKLVEMGLAVMRTY